MVGRWFTADRALEDEDNDVNFHVEEIDSA
jgi:hypothetical protein